MVPEIQGATDKKFCHFGAFLPFQPPDNLENQNFKIENFFKHLEILSFYMCTINNNHMMYGSRDIEHDRQNFLSFWISFGSFHVKWTKAGHDPSQILMKLFQMKGIYKIRLS